VTTVLELAILMALRVHGRSDAVQVARATACSEAEAAAALAALQARGAVTPAARGAASASSPALATLTDAGRAELTALLAAEPLDRPALARLYDRFLVADDELKAAITAWQLASALDKPAAQDRVMAAAETAGGVAAALAEIAPRLTPYPRRIAAAAAAIATGDARFVASPRVDSLHQVWFELHEDVLVTLGRSRAT
jgi:DNA-binding MarR family transcriptional regulator